MKNYKIIFLIVVLFLIPIYPQHSAKEILNKSFEAMGGREKLDNLKSVEIQRIGYRHFIEQSERPEGPWISSYTQTHEIKDLTKHNIWREVKNRFWINVKWSDTYSVKANDVVMMKRNGKEFPGQPAQLQKDKEYLRTSPERILITAEKSGNLKYDGEKKFNGLKHYIISFNITDAHYRLYISSYTYLISALEKTSYYPDDFFNSIWGDITELTKYGDYNLEQGGIRYPHKIDKFWNGFLSNEYTIAQVVLNGKVSADSFKISSEVKKQFANIIKAPKFTPQTIKLGQGFNRQMQERSTIGENITIIPGVYTVTLVPQDDGVIIIEAPISNHYTQLVLKEVEDKFPGKKIKGVISTGDAWTYMGGMREYAADQIPIYALVINKPIITRLLNAPFTTNPDNLALEKIKPVINYSNKKEIIGSGKNRVEIYPVRGNGGERMSLVYFPEYEILYSSDLIQPAPDGIFSPEYLLEVIELLKKIISMLSSVTVCTSGLLIGIRC